MSQELQRLSLVHFRRSEDPPSEEDKDIVKGFEKLGQKPGNIHIQTVEMREGREYVIHRLYVPAE